LNKGRDILHTVFVDEFLIMNISISDASHPPDFRFIAWISVMIGFVGDCIFGSIVRAHSILMISSIADTDKGLWRMGFLARTVILPDLEHRAKTNLLDVLHSLIE
jgi:hypothetical protein